MVDNSIEQTRQALEQAKQSAQAQPEKRRAFTPRKERAERGKFVREVTDEQKRFEKEVAKSRPEQATPEALDVAYKEAKAGVQNLYNNSNNRLKGYKEQLKKKQNWWDAKKSEYKSKGNRRENYNKDVQGLENKIDAQEAETRSLGKSLGASKVGMVKNYFSGYTANIADFERERQESKQDQRVARKQSQQKAVQEYKSKWESEGSKLGMKPMFSSKGDIIGFEDSQKQMSYNLEQLGYQRPESLAKLKQAGLIDYQTSKPEPKRDLRKELSPVTDIFGFSHKPYVSEKKPSKIEVLTDFGILPSIEPIKERVSKIKDWYGRTGETKAVMVEIVDEQNKPTGQRVLVSGGELTKGERLSGKIKASKFYKQATFYKDPYYKKGAAVALGGAALAVGTVAVPALGISSLIGTGAKGAGQIIIGKTLKPDKSKILYGSQGFEKIGLMGLYGAGTLLETKGELTLLAPPVGKVATKIPKISKVIGAGGLGFYGYGVGKQAIQAESLTELGLLGVEVGSQVAAFKPVKAFKEKRIYKRDINNYNEALKEFESLKRSAKLADTTIEKPYTSVGRLRVGELEVQQQNNVINDLKKLNIPREIPTGIMEIQVKQSYSQVITRVPKMNKISVPKSSPLYKKQKFVYQVTVGETIKYKNIVTYDFVLKNGKYVSYSVTSFSNKPLTKFRSINNAIKYGSGKKITVSAPISDELVGSQMFDFRGGQFKPTDRFISRPEKYKIRGKIFEGAETVKVGKALGKYPGINIAELYDISPKVGRAVSKSKSVKSKKASVSGRRFEEFDLLEFGVTKTTRAEDLSILNKLVRERAKYFAKIKPPRIRALTSDQKKFEINKLDDQIKKFRRKPPVKTTTLPTDRHITVSKAPTTLTDLKTEVIQSIPTLPRVRVRAVSKPPVQRVADNLIMSVIPASATATRQAQGTIQKSISKQATDFLSESLMDTRLASATVQVKAKAKDKRLADKKISARARARPRAPVQVTAKIPAPYRSRPSTPLYSLIPDIEKPKRKKKKIFKKKKRKFALRRTGLQAALGLKATRAKALPDITGFEMFR